MAANGKKDPIEVWLHRGYTAEQAKELLAWTAAEKRRLRRVARKTVGTPAETMNVRRHAEEVIRRKIRKFIQYTPSSLPKVMLAARFQKCSNPRWNTSRA